jgi:type VI protein secretion system component Hcp
MPLDGYMYFVNEGRHKNKANKWKSVGTVKGETPDERFQAKGAFQIWYFKWECKHDNSSGSSRFDPAVTVGSFRVKKEIDIATPTLFLANVTRSVFQGAHVFFRKSAGSSLQTFFHAIFSDVIIEHWAIDLDGEDTKEELTVNFNWCEVNYYPQTKEGTRKKGDPANMKQFCVSDPESQDVPRVFRRENKNQEEGDLNLGALYGE